MGTAEGSTALRKACSNHVWHFHEKTVIFDCGNIRCAGGGLEEAQEELRKTVSQIRAAGYFTMVFGGGTKWPGRTMLALLTPCQKKE